MDIEICPLAADIGNWADWAAVAVGTLAAIGTIGVAVLANRTSKRATEIAEEATRIAKQQHQEAARLRGEDARIIGRLLLYEIDAAPRRLAALAAKWRACIAWDDDARIIDLVAFRDALADAAVPVFPGAETVESRIHNLPNALGANLATLIGGSRTLSVIVRKIEPRVHQPTFVGDRISYQGSVHDLRTMQHQLNWLASMSEALAAEFRAFVGVSDAEMNTARMDVESA